LILRPSQRSVATVALPHFEQGTSPENFGRSLPDTDVHLGI
jgi:hypothetical protein